jgi:hypothetical protein
MSRESTKKASKDDPPGKCALNDRAPRETPDSALACVICAASELDLKSPTSIEEVRYGQ